ncbi:MAG: hypothetical protein H0U75_07300 [Legionella sp.]|nr:hypothetical protein [Legionella sp.]
MRGTRVSKEQNIADQKEPLLDSTLPNSNESNENSAQSTAAGQGRSKTEACSPW